MWVEKQGKHFIYSAQDWTEHFRIQVSNLLLRSKREGDMMPRFYLPVWRSNYQDSVECWIFPLAPFILALRITQQIFSILWRDLIDWLRLLYQWRNK